MSDFKSNIAGSNYNMSDRSCDSESSCSDDESWESSNNEDYQKHVKCTNSILSLDIEYLHKVHGIKIDKEIFFSDDEHSDDDNTEDMNSRKSKNNSADFEYLCNKFDINIKDILRSSYSCHHNKAKCHIVCNACNKTYPCVKCHNNSENHSITNKDISDVECVRCPHLTDVDDYIKKQKISDSCKDCGIMFGNYHCKKCKIIDGRGINMFHCSKCNLCIVGKRSMYKHCEDCERCVPRNIFRNHTCETDQDLDSTFSEDSGSGGTIRKMNCVVCLDSFWKDVCIINKCGHMLHHDCYEILIKSCYNFPKCPKCFKSMVDPSQAFSEIEEEIQNTPLPEDLKKIVKIRCVECNKISNADYHYLGTKCPRCSGYNTLEI